MRCVALCDVLHVGQYAKDIQHKVVTEVQKLLRQRDADIVDKISKDVGLATDGIKVDVDVFTKAVIQGKDVLDFAGM